MSGFPTYGHIGHSHKVLLTHVEDIERKKQLVEETAEQQYTVARLRDRIKRDNRRLLITADKVPVNNTLEKEERTHRKVGFRDWTDRNINIQTGCSNNCRYCYAKMLAERRGQVAPGSWENQILRIEDVDKVRNLYHGLVGFPSTHDITPTNINAYLTVLGKLLRAGNEVLIVSKPRIDCIRQICEACLYFKDKILFRFTIGAMDDDILGIWEPNAPRYVERRACLEFAYNQGFRTSVSMEPMLDTPRIEEQIADLRQFVTEDIWLGTMNHLEQIKKGADDELTAAITKVEAGQIAERLTAIYQTYKDDPLIKWKTETENKIADPKKKRVPSIFQAINNPEELEMEELKEARSFDGINNLEDYEIDKLLNSSSKITDRVKLKIENLKKEIEVYETEFSIYEYWNNHFSIAKEWHETLKKRQSGDETVEYPEETPRLKKLRDAVQFMCFWKGYNYSDFLLEKGFKYIPFEEASESVLQLLLRKGKCDLRTTYNYEVTKNGKFKLLSQSQVDKRIEKGTFWLSEERYRQLCFYNFRDYE